MQKIKSKYFAFTCFIGALGTQIEQYVVYGHWWDVNQMLHHETLSIGLIALGVGILIGGYLCKKKK